MFEFKWLGKHKANCPLCHLRLEFHLEDDTQLERYNFADDLLLAANGECPFCKTRVAILFDKNGLLKCRDTHWDKTEHQYYSKYDEIESEIKDLEFELVHNHDLDDSIIEKFDAKIAKLHKKRKTSEESFQTKEINYQNKQDRWHERAYAKFGDDAF